MERGDFGGACHYRNKRFGNFPGGPVIKKTTFLMQEAQVPSLVRELKSHMPQGAANFFSFFD